MEQRKPGCRALYQDGGEQYRPLIPVCMGGPAVAGAEVTIVGCNNYDVCKETYKADPGWADAILRNDDGRVSRVVSVRRGDFSTEYHS